MLGGFGWKSFFSIVLPMFLIVDIKDRHQWFGREFRCSLSQSIDKLFPRAIICNAYH